MTNPADEFANIKLTPNEERLLRALGTADDDGNPVQTVGQIMKATGMNGLDVMHAMRGLEGYGFVEKVDNDKSR